MASVSSRIEAILAERNFSIVINIDQPRAGALGKIGPIAVRQTAIGGREIGNALPPHTVEASCLHPHHPCPSLSAFAVRIAKPK
jgi:hypothetical protein